MTDRQKKAEELFSNGFNCSQAALTAFTEDTGISDELALKISTGFGGGMAGMQNTCGAVTGAFMVLGLLYGKFEKDDNESKQKTYKLINKFVDDFKQINGSIYCFELLGYDLNNPEERKKIDELDLFNTKCKKYIKDAVELLESQYLTEE